MNSSVSIIIVNYNSAPDLKNCIRSIYDNIKLIQFEILVVDNNSPERDITTLPEDFPGVKYFFLKDNLGFSKANNFAAAKANYENLLFLNPDTLFIHDCVSGVLEFLQRDSSAGACGVKLLNGDKTFQFSFGKKLGLIYESAEALMLIGLYRKLYYKSLEKKISNGDKIKVEWLSGAFIIMKKSLFNSVGGFSPDFFLNYEDIDLCSRISAKGYDNYYLPEFECIHLDSKSQKKNYENFVINRYKSRLIFARENYLFFKRVMVRLIHISGLILRILTVSFLYKGSEKSQRRIGYIKSFLIYLGK